MPTCSPIPRPEYPRPDRQRGLVEGIDWLNLNGPWQFRFDPQRSGEEEGWFKPGGLDWREQIIVPFCWESLAAWGEADASGNDNYFSTRVFIDPVSIDSSNHRSAPRYEVGWYRRVVEIPTTALWQGKRVILTVGAADYFTSAWCNGILVGRHEGGYVPLEFDLTDALAASNSNQAVLVLRVEDPMDNHEQPVGKQWGWYTPTSGIWQTVFLEPRATAYIDHFRIIPDIDSATVSFQVICRSITEGARASVELISPETPLRSVELTLNGSTASGRTQLSPLLLWEPGSPRLYRAVFRLACNGQEDVVHSYFGMRKIHTNVANDSRSPAQLCLNNQPIYLRGALYQSYHPDGVYTATEASTLRDDINYARSAGFDFLRVHIKLDDPLLLFYADTAGMLLMQDFPNFGEGGDTPLGRERFEQMLRKGMERDFNHPSIIAWCLFNETWGFGGQTELMKLIAPTLSKKEARIAAQKVANTPSFKWVHAMWQVAKGIDSTRLIEDMSVVVWEHLAAYGHVDTDINSWHFYLDDYQKAKAHIEEVVAKSYPGSGYNYVEGHLQKNAPLINSEYGGVGALDGDRDVSWTFKFLTNELRRHGQLSAYIFTQLTDVEWERNGLLNYDRTAKQCGYPPNLVNQGDVLPINAAPIALVPPGSNVDVEILSSHFSRRPRENVTLHWHYTGVDTLGILHNDLARGWTPIPFTQHRVERARLLSLTVPREPMLCTLWVAAVAGNGETVATNFIQHYVADGPPPEREDRGRTLILRRRVQHWHAAGWQGGTCTRQEAEKRHFVFGRGAGFFEWLFEDESLGRLAEARRVQFLCEVSSHRDLISQTDSHAYPTEFEMRINDLPVHREVLPNHPHDTRGALSYLKGQAGCHGYLMKAVCEAPLLTRIAESIQQRGNLSFRCAVPETALAQGGLTVYGYDTGRYPIGVTMLIEWAQAA